MCAVDAQITAPQRGSSDCSDRTFAPVPLKTGKHSMPGAEVLFHHILQPCRVVVLAVGDLVAVVGRGEGREDLGVDAGVVVGGETADGGVVEPWPRCRQGQSSTVVVIALVTLSV